MNLSFAAYQEVILVLVKILVGGDLAPHERFSLGHDLITLRRLIQKLCCVGASLEQQATHGRQHLAV